MRYLGIDYGSKRIGLALSDESAFFAFPKGVIESSRNAANEIKAICRKEGISEAVVGESRNFKGQENLIMTDTKRFVSELEALGLTVIYEPEIFSTVQAQQIQGDSKDLDASAAAVILQSYLDRLRFRSAGEAAADAE